MKNGAVFFESINFENQHLVLEKKHFRVYQNFSIFRETFPYYILVKSYSGYNEHLKSQIGLAVLK